MDDFNQIFFLILVEIAKWQNSILLTFIYINTKNNFLIPNSVHFLNIFYYKYTYYVVLYLKKDGSSSNISKRLCCIIWRKFHYRCCCSELETHCVIAVYLARKKGYTHHTRIPMIAKIELFIQDRARPYLLFLKYSARLKTSTYPFTHESDSLFFNTKKKICNKNINQKGLHYNAAFSYIMHFYCCYYFY